MAKARDFLHSVVKPTTGEFLADVTNLRRARLAAIVLYHTSDYWHFENKNLYPQLTDLLKKLGQECPEFVVVRDVANVSKHCFLDRPSQTPREIRSSDQVTMTPGLFNAPFGEGVFAEAVEVVVNLDDGQTKPFAPIARSVLAMWESKITGHSFSSRQVT